jgi:hypothetical protein
VGGKKNSTQNYVPNNANGLEEGDVHETDGGRVVVHQVEPVDSALHHHIDLLTLVVLGRVEADLGSN